MSFDRTKLLNLRFGRCYAPAAMTAALVWGGCYALAQDASDTRSEGNKRDDVVAEETVVEGSDLTVEELLRINRDDWREVQNWFQRSPYYTQWMTLLKRNDLQNQWNRTDSLDVGTLSELEHVFAHYQDMIKDERYNRFVASFNRWKNAAVRESIMRLADRIERQKNLSPAVTPDRSPAFARQRIGSAMQNVQNRLYAFTQQGANDWRRFLKWDTLEDLSRGDDPLPLETLMDLQVIMRNGVVVWDIEPMRQLQKAIDDATVLAAINSEEDFIDARKDRLQELADGIRTYAKEPTEQNRKNLGTPLAWLRLRGELKDMLPLIQFHFSHPNFRYETTTSVIERDVNQFVDESFPVNDYYNGSYVSGQGRLTGKVTASLIPNSRQASWELKMDGQVFSNTSSYGSGVGVNSSGSTVVTAYKHVSMDASGMRSQPATSSANTSITYNSIDASRYGSYAGIAQSRVYGNRGSSEYQAARSTESFISQRLNTDGSKYVRDYNDKYQENFVYPRARQLAWPHQFQIYSTNDLIVMDMLDAPLDSLGAATAPPTAPFEADSYVKSHGSSFDAYCVRKLAGKRLTVVELRKIMEDLGMKDVVAASAEEGDDKTEKSTAEKDDKSAANDAEGKKDEDAVDSVEAMRLARTLSFPARNPIEFTLADGMLTGLSHLEGFSSDGKDYPAMEVRFIYRLSAGEGGMHIVREKLEAWPADFVPGSGQRLSGPQLVVRKLLVNVLSDALPEHAVVERIAGGLGEEMPVSQVVGLGEWLCIGLKLP